MSQLGPSGIGNIERKLEAQEKLVARLQRAKERQGAHLLGQMEANDRLTHEVKRLEARMVAVYIEAENPKAVREIIEKTIPSAIKKWKNRR